MAKKGTEKQIFIAKSNLACIGKLNFFKFCLSSYNISLSNPLDLCNFVLCITVITIELPDIVERMENKDDSVTLCDVLISDKAKGMYNYYVVRL